MNDFAIAILCGAIAGALAAMLWHTLTHHEYTLVLKTGERVDIEVHIRDKWKCDRVAEKEHKL